MTNTDYLREMTWSDDEIKKVQCEFTVEGYAYAHVAAILILEARADRDIALNRMRRIAIENGRLRQLIERPGKEPSPYATLKAQEVAERVGFAKGIDAARMYADGHASSLRVAAGSLRDIIARVKARVVG